MEFFHVMDRFFGTPLLLLPEKAATIAGLILSRSSGDAPIFLDAGGDETEVEANRFIGTRRRASGSASLARAANGVAVVDIVGSLVNRGAWVGANSGLVSYEGIGAQVDDAVADPEVTSILLDINSPGGEATGMFGLAEKVRAARSVKPVVAVVNDVAASAAYGVASAADEIVVSPTSIVGSIGVVMMHVDRTEEKAKAGIVETAIFAGANKTLGMGRLTADARANYQALVNSFYDRFLETVEAGRGERTTAEMARATEASAYIGRDAISAGLADRVGTFDQVLAELSNRPAARRAKPTGPAKMNTSTPFSASADSRPAGAATHPSPNTNAAAVATWDRVLDQVDGTPKTTTAATPTPSSTDPIAAMWDAVIRRVDSVGTEPAPTATAAEVGSAWDRVITLVTGDDPTTVGRPLGPVVGPARQGEWWR